MYKFLISIISKLKKNKLFADSLWSLLGNTIGKGLALVAGIFIARFLGKDVFGEYGIIRNTILTVGIFSTLGLGYTSTKFISDYKKKSPEKVRLFVKYAYQITIVFSSLMALFLFVFSDYIAIDLLKVPHLGCSLKFLSILTIFNAVITTQIGILSGFARFKEIAKINSFTGLLTFVFSIFFTYLFNLNGALFSLLIVQIINTLINYNVIRKELEVFEKLALSDIDLLKKTVRFSIPIALREVLYSVTTWLTSIILVRYISSSNMGPMPEVLKEGGFYFNPLDVDSIYLSLKQMLDNEKLRQEKSLISYNNSISYTWKDCSDRTLYYLSTIAKQS